jgi:5-methylcytosine-specific restriction endonuclease McrA
MPSLPPTHKVRKTGAPKHTRDGERQARRYYHTAHPQWLAQRQRILLRDSYQCRHCGQWGNHVDHIDNDAHKDVSDDRLQTLCLECHGRKTRAEQGDLTWTRI